MIQKVTQLFFICLVLLFYNGYVHAQNLIQDPGAETDPVWNGWTQISGNWHSGNTVARPPGGGDYYFYAGQASQAVAGISELIQDVDVSDNAGNIDAGLATYTFSAWMRIYATLNDRGRIYVEYRDASSAILYTYTTGINTSLNWIRYTDVHSAPAGTRTIRIRLQSLFIQGSESDGYMDNLSLTVVNTVTPIELLSFEVRSVEDRTTIFWSTASEENNNFFTIEKSIDMFEWVKVDTIPGAGNSSSLLHYTAYDANEVTGTVYYRLKQTDYDGTSTYSEIRVLYKEAVFQIYPNPASENLHVVISSEIPLSYTFIDAMGRALNVPYVEIENEHLFDTTSLPKGMYVFLIQTNTKSITKKVLIE